MIIGITGTLGAGKGTVVKYLVEHKGFAHLSARALFQELMEKAGIAIDRDNMVLFANDLRAKHGPDFVFRELFLKAQSIGGNVIIESLRTPAEAMALKSQPDSILLAVDADQQLRYERIHGRDSELDHVSFEKFVEQENTEMRSDDPNKQNIAAVMAMADATLMNNKDPETLFAAVEAFLNQTTT